MTLGEVKKGILALLESRYPKEKYKYYSKAVVKGFTRPCFFTQMIPSNITPENYNTRKLTVLFYITIFQDTIDEADALDMIDSIQNLFGLAVKIGDRAIDVTNYNWSFIGNDQNIPEIVVTLDWMDEIIRDEEKPPAAESTGIIIKTEGGY